jgi:predicted nucleotidyltransferase
MPEHVREEIRRDRFRIPEDLLRSVVARLDPRRVVLFGARARGDATSESDWDLLIVLDDDAPAERLDWRALHEARRGFRGAVDLIPCRDSDFRERVDVVGSLAWIAATEGVVVYERADAA